MAKVYYIKALETMGKIEEAIASVKEAKPGDRSERDRYCQIVITDLEKAKAVFQAYVLEGD